LPEAGRHAPILIAASWQALGRAHNEGPDTIICNCTIVVLFAGFYIEANLNHIVRVLKLQGRLSRFVRGKKHPGLQDKLAWFYNDFISLNTATDLNTARSHGIDRQVRRRFPGFARLYRFRNNISHGVINRNGRSLAEAQKLRQQAIDIVSDLFWVLDHHGRNVRRATSYWQAIQH
jgi:hypothetical protein